MQRYAPDTNFFLQFKPAEDLPWLDLTEAADIELIVLSEVLRELDNHKNGGNERRAQRSRRVLQLCRPLIVGESEELQVREKSPRVTYRLAPALSGDQSKRDSWDTSTADGRIVGEALACDTLVGGLSLLTHDSLPMLTARRQGLSVVLLPDSWRLAPERDAKDKEIASLREELMTIRQRKPDVVVQVLHAGESVKRIEGNLVRYTSLSAQFLMRAMRALTARHPDEASRIAGRITVTREADRETYERERAKWVATVRDKLERHPNVLNLENSVFPLNLTFQNLGSESAESLVVEIFAEGSIRLVSPDGLTRFLQEYKFELPRPPRMRYLMDFGDLSKSYNTPLSDIHRFRGMDNPPNILPRDFHWQFDSSNVSSPRLEGVCADFRHQIHKEEVLVALSVPVVYADNPVGRIRIRYSAKNLIQSVEKVWPVRFTYAWRDTEPVTEQFLKEQLDVQLG
ncbi:PIN domain-containing protein [Achromobacter veterisilvae]|uniref:PIN domain-containing protein n=1 Tax=Achromobacter veterisilvae TaxID=2069367 RepID=A0ABZ2RUJ3_9BURK